MDEDNQESGKTESKRRISLPGVNEYHSHEARKLTTIDENEAYRTPSWRSLPNITHLGALAPRKKKVQAPSRRSSAPANMNKSWEAVRKHLDFSEIIMEPFPADETLTDSKRKVETDKTLGKLTDLLAPLVQLQLHDVDGSVPTLCRAKKMKFSGEIQLDDPSLLDDSGVGSGPITPVTPKSRNELLSRDDILEIDETPFPLMALYRSDVNTDIQVSVDSDRRPKPDVTTRNFRDMSTRIEGISMSQNIKIANAALGVKKSARNLNFHEISKCE